MSTNLPYEWKEHVDETTNRTYYYNNEIQQRLWVHPLKIGPENDLIHTTLLSDGWKLGFDETHQHVYFYNKALNKTQWTCPVKKTGRRYDVPELQDGPSIYFVIPALPASKSPLLPHEILESAKKKSLFPIDTFSVSTPVLHILPQTIKDWVEKEPLSKYWEIRFNVKAVKKKVSPSQYPILCSHEPITQFLLNDIPVQYIKEAVRSFDEILLYMGWRKDVKFDEDRKKEENKDPVGASAVAATSTFSSTPHLQSVAYAQLAAAIVDRVLLTPCLADEVLIQIIRQISGNKDRSALHKCWELLYLCLSFFTPSKDFERFLLNFLNNEIIHAAEGKGCSASKDGNSPTEGSGEEKEEPGSGDGSGDDMTAATPPISTTPSSAGGAEDDLAELYAQMCLDCLHCTTLFTAHNLLIKMFVLPTKVEANPAAAVVSATVQTMQEAIRTFGVAAANEKAVRKMQGMVDRTRTYGTHLRHIMFHQVNKYRHFFLIAAKTQNKPAIQKVVANLSFQLPPIPAPTPSSSAVSTIPTCASLQSLALYYLPKILIYLGMKIIECTGLDEEGVFRRSVNKNSLDEYIAILNEGIDVREKWIVPLTEDGEGIAGPPTAFPASYVPFSSPSTSPTSSSASFTAAPDLQHPHIVIDIPINARFKHINEECKDPVMFASLLKFWLRELEEPLIPFNKYDETLKYITTLLGKRKGQMSQNPSPLTSTAPVTAEAQDIQSAILLTRYISQTLPPLNSTCIKYLIHYLRYFLIPEFLEKNKMVDENMAVVIGPNVIRKDSNDPKEMGMNYIRELPFMRVLLGDLIISPEEEILFETAEREVIDEFGMDIHNWVNLRQKSRAFQAKEVKEKEDMQTEKDDV